MYMKCSIDDVYHFEYEKTKKYCDHVNQLVSKNSFPEKLSLPLSIQLELTEKCNLKCKHCYNSSGDVKNKTNLTVADWENISKEIVIAGGVFQVILSGGEPLLLGDGLFDIMDIFHEDGAKFILITNGYLLNESVVRKLTKYNFSWLQVSIDGITPEHHDEFRQRTGSWKRAIKGAILAANEGIPVKIASSLAPSEIDNIGKYVDMAFKVGASAIMLGDIMPSGRSFDNKEVISNRDFKYSLLNEVAVLKESYKDKIEVQTSGFIKLQLIKASSGTLDSIIIRPNGDLRLDCIAPFVVGNVKNKSFKAEWDKIPWNIWKNRVVSEYIDSIDEITGTSSMIGNYHDGDITLDI